jgi:phage shock protein A
MMRNLRLYSYDMDAIMGMSREQLEGVMRANEQEMLELYNDNRQLREKIKQNEADIRYLTEKVKAIEAIKIEQKASKSVWQVIAIAMGAVGAIFGAIFFRKDRV